jgi:hypothetical protein
VGFVDDLTHRLEKAGFNVWLDYRRLIPGTPWAGQIDKGLKEAEVVLLVVSKSSIASQYVELEWRHVLNETNKRIVLAIFEAVDLPPELEKYEWVDFRGHYEEGLKELIRQLQTPEKEEHPAPETGFKIPSGVWQTFFVSIGTALISLFAWWSLFLPIILVPLPYRILKRNFNYALVRYALWMMPIMLLFTFVNVGDNNQDLSVILSILTFLIAPAACGFLLLILSSPGNQRWGKPEATKPQFANLYRPNIPNPSPISFFIDHAPQDRHMANELRKKLAQYGHPQAADIKSAQSVFVLISTYKNDSEADPENQVVFPVLIQTAMPAERLSKVQWIDLRKGIGNLDAIAQLLPDPSKLLTALGVRPTGNQLVLPSAINTAVYFLISFAVITVGSFVYDVFYNRSFAQDQFNGFLNILLMCGLIYLMVRGLITRRGWLASIPGFVIGYLIFGYLSFIGSLFSIGDSESASMLTSTTSIILYWSGAFLLTLVTMVRFGEILRWYPAWGRAK